MIESGADVMAKDFEGLTALHLAFKTRGHKSVAILLDAGADINSTDLNGKTPLHYLF